MSDTLVQGAGAGPRRTDPRSAAVQMVSAGVRMVVPVAFGAIAILDKDDFGLGAGAFAALLLAVVLANAAIVYLRWTRLTYEVRESDIRVESGLVSRTARSVPYERIQDVSLEQKLLPRLFGLTEVRFETGAGGGEDLSLSYLSEAEGERLRQVVRARREGDDAARPAHADGAAAAAADEPAEVLFAMSPRRIATFGLFEFSLAAVAALLGAAQQFDFLLPFEWWDVRQWNRILSGSGHWLAGLGMVAKVVALAGAVGSLLLVGFATGVLRTALREWDFRLERSDKGLRRRRGLITRTDVVMPLHRVQAVRIATGFIRRKFGWHALEVVSLASDSGKANHDAVPFGTMAEIAPVLGETGFALPGDDLAWQRSAWRYRMDEGLLGAFVFATIAGGNLLFGDWRIALIPALAAVTWPVYHWLRWRTDRHAMDARQLYTRQGWFRPRTTVASRTRLQSVEIARGPLARLRGHATLNFGLAGGHFAMHGLPLAEARRIRDAVAVSLSHSDFSAIAAPAE